MLRRDYILRMIEEFVRALARLNTLKQERRFGEASIDLKEQFERLLGTDPQSALRLSDTVLLSKLIANEPSQPVRDKALMAARLFFEEGELAAAREEEASAYYLKGLHLLLHTLRQHDLPELPEYVPTVERFVHAVRDVALPLQTSGLLMEHYERAGQFAKAEDMLFQILEGSPENTALVEFGEAFYRRLENQSEAALLGGGLSPEEVKTGIEELRRKFSV